MFYNNLKIAVRHLLRNKLTGLINIFGLSLGMTCCLLIYLYVQDELSFDQHHQKGEQIYRVVLEQFDTDRSNSRTWASVSAGYGQRLKNTFPAIKSSVRFWPWSFPIISNGEHKFMEGGFMFVEPAVFDIFSHSFIAGDPSTALIEPNTVVLTKSIAEKYFGSENPLGKSIEYFSRGNRLDFKVTGIIKDLPENVHFTYDLLASFSTWENLSEDEDFEFLAGNYNYPTYLLLEEQASVKDLKSQLPSFLENNLEDFNNMRPSDRFHILLQPLKDIHLGSDFTSDYATTGSWRFIYIFIGIGLLILIIACINFINLATARATRRSKEVGMRKVLGARRFQLIGQFLGESTFVSLLSLCLSLLLIEAILPFFNEFAEKHLSVNYLNGGTILLTILGIVIIVGLLAGSYPALILSRFKPLQALSSFKLPGSSNSLMRSGLVTFQFVISIVLLIGVLVIQKQLDFMQSKDLGFNQEQLLTIRASNPMIEDLSLIKGELLQQPGVLNVSASSRIPSGNLGDSFNAKTINEGTEEIVGFRMPFVRIESDFFKVLDSKIIAGRNISKDRATDTISSFILNETAVAQLGWENETVIGKPFIYGRGRGNIVGVVKDFHFESMHHQIKPTIFFASNYLNWIILRVQPDKLPGILSLLEEKWDRYQPDYPFSYSFVDESFARRYASEQQLGEVFQLFAFLAIVIACLGLFGLAVFTTEQRTKEIAIRKTLGASITNIFALLSSNFLKVMLVANLLAWPLAYFGMQEWLNGFAYRTSISWSLLLLAGVFALLIAFLTISFQSIKAALANPVNSLRSE